MISTGYSARIAATAGTMISGLIASSRLQHAYICCVFRRQYAARSWSEGDPGFCETTRSFGETSGSFCMLSPVAAAELRRVADKIAESRVVIGVLLSAGSHVIAEPSLDRSDFQFQLGGDFA